MKGLEGDSGSEEGLKEALWGEGQNEALLEGIML